MTIDEGSSKPGDYVVLRSEPPVIVVISNCPQENTPAAGFSPTPIEVTVSCAAAMENDLTEIQKANATLTTTHQSTAILSPGDSDVTDLANCAIGIQTPLPLRPAVFVQQSNRSTLQS